jgi:branched-chain amino acid aminotransferase
MLDIANLWAYVNGTMVRSKEATVSLYDRGILWGDAVYEAIRTYNRKPFRVADRIERFFRSLYYARIDPGLSKETLRQITNDVVQANVPLLGPHEDLTINYYASRGSMAIHNGRTPAGTIAIFCQPIAFASFARFYVTGAPGVIPATRRTPPQCVSYGKKIRRCSHYGSYDPG